MNSSQKRVWAVSALLDEETEKQLIEICADTGMTVSEVINYAIKNFRQLKVGSLQFGTETETGIQWGEKIPTRYIDDLDASV